MTRYSWVLQLLDELLGSWVDEITLHGALIARLHKRGKTSSSAPVLSASDVHAAVRDAYPMLVLPTDSLIEHKRPKAPPMELIKRERAAASAALAAAQASIAAGGTAPTTVQLAPVALGGGADGEGVARKRPRSTGPKSLLTGNEELFDPDTGLPLKRPRGRPSKAWLAREEEARQAALKRQAAATAGKR